MPGKPHTDFAAGEAVGHAVGAQVVASATTDRFNAVWTGTIPVCPGCWRSNGPGLPPLLPWMGQMRPFFMEVGSQFRPAPPPAFGSREFLEALAEVRRFSDTRTAERAVLKARTRSARCAWFLTFWRSYVTRVHHVCRTGRPATARLRHRTAEPRRADGGGKRFDGIPNRNDDRQRVGAGNTPL